MQLLSEHVLPEGPLSSRPQMPPKSELQKPDVSTLTGFQERSAVLRSPHFLLHTHSLVLCGGKQEAFTPPRPHLPSQCDALSQTRLCPGHSYRYSVTHQSSKDCLVCVGERLGKPRLWDPPPPPYPSLGYHSPFTSQTKDRPRVSQNN